VGVEPPALAVVVVVVIVVVVVVVVVVVAVARELIFESDSIDTAPLVPSVSLIPFSQCWLKRNEEHSWPAGIVSASNSLALEPTVTSSALKVASEGRLALTEDRGFVCRNMFGCERAVGIEPPGDSVDEDDADELGLWGLSNCPALGVALMPSDRDGGWLNDRDFVVFSVLPAIDAPEIDSSDVLFLPNTSFSSFPFKFNTNSPRDFDFRASLKASIIASA
jgi:hypothetical protein